MPQLNQHHKNKHKLVKNNQFKLLKARQVVLYPSSVPLSMSNLMNNYHPFSMHL
jgi:hypothetical protein